MSNKSALSNLKLVTVDDSPIVAERLQVIFNDLENITYLGNALNIASAKTLIAEKQPNVVILDIHLTDDAPHANGINLLTDLRKKYPHLIIIMLTNLVDEHYNNICKILGADYFLDKSIDFTKIQDILEEIQKGEGTVANENE